jgi:hypothetical protein
MFPQQPLRFVITQPRSLLPTMRFFAKAALFDY